MVRRWGIRGFCMALAFIVVGILLLSCEPDRPKTSPERPKPSQHELASFLADCKNGGWAMKFCMKDAQAKYGLTEYQIIDILAPPK